MKSDPLSQAYAIVILTLHYLQQKRDKESLHARWPYIDHATRDTLLSSVKAVGQGIIDRWGVIAVDDEAYVIKTQTRRDRNSVVVVHSEVEHVELLPHFSLGTSIGIENIHTCEVIDEYIA